MTPEQFQQFMTVLTSMHSEHLSQERRLTILEVSSAERFTAMLESMKEHKEAIEDVRSGQTKMLWTVACASIALIVELATRTLIK